MSGIISNQESNPPYTVDKTSDKEPGITTSMPGFKKVSELERLARRSVFQAGQAIDMLSVMGMSRKDRRRIAKINEMRSIKGSVKPFVKTNQD